jgi:hypothetical protein
MAQRFWIGNTGTWDNSTTTNWSTSSGGAGGASVPTSSDDVFFDANSFTLAGSIVAVDAVTVTCNSMSWSGALHTPTLLLFSSFGTSAIAMSGSLLLIPDMVLSSNSVSNTLDMVGTGIGNTITLAGQTLPCVFDFNGSGGEWTFQDGVVLAEDVAIEFRNGSVMTNNVSFTLPTRCTFQVNGGTVDLGASVINLTASGVYDAEFRVDSGSIAAASSTLTFQNTGSGYAILRNNTGAPITYGAVIFGSGLYFTTGDWNYTSLTLGAGSNGQFGFGSTIDGSSGSFITTGTAGNHAILTSDDPLVTPFTLLAGATAIAYLDVSDATAGGAAIPFINAGGIDNGDNTNWSFVAGGPAPTFTNTPGAYNPSPFGHAARNQKPSGSDILQRKPQGSSIKTGKPNLA